MRRKDREIVSQSEIIKILHECKVCRLAMVDGNRPYVLPMNFGFETHNNSITFYLHGATEGRKLDIIRRNPYVCVEVDCEHRLTEAKEPCGYGFNFASVIGEGKAEILTDSEEKARGLSILMSHQTGKEFFFTAPQTNTVCVIKIHIDNITAKRRKV